MTDKQEIDPRIVRLSLNINGVLKQYASPIRITSTGQKFANALQNQCEVEIFNLTKSDRDYILAETSPYNKNRAQKFLILEAGRVSTGYSEIIKANISSCVPTQPPDIGLKFKCLSEQYLNGQVMSLSQPGQTNLSVIAGQVAGQLGKELNFQANDKAISNYAWTGPAAKQIQALGDVGAVDAYIDGNQLIVKNMNIPLTGVLRILDDHSGMIGIPEITEQGIKITYMLDNASKLGGALQVTSQMYPTVNGTYVIYKLGWNIASRDVPFYWIGEAVRLEKSGGVVVPATAKKKKGKHRA